jgi:uncharacterized repeat protein (TIGR03803 family)
MREGRFFLPSAIFLLVASALASGQGRETVLYSFGTNANDGSIPNGGLVFDAAGNLYGTTQRGGANAGGVVFELTPVEGGGWSETVLYNFCAETNCADGGLPLAGLILDSAGNLYGTTAVGGAYSGGTCRAAGCGTVFELSPPAATGGAWTELVLWNFKGDLNNDGSEPASRLNRDADGNLYGTTMSGGNANALGTVFELTPISGGSWSEGVLYVFCQNGPPCPDGVFPDAGVSFDAIGNLYGTTLQGGVDDQWGTVYMLSPRTGGYWAETTLYQFTPQSGGNPHSVVNFDPAGNLYGTVSAGGQGCGGVWRLTLGEHGVRAAISLFEGSGASGCGPLAGVFMDNKTSSVFGTTSTGGAFDGGAVYRISGARRRVIYDFCQQTGCTDGSAPSGSFTSRKGALYSTTAKGGAFNQGVVFAITP